jgi:hypothetical protein
MAASAPESVSHHFWSQDAGRAEMTKIDIIQEFTKARVFQKDSAALSNPSLKS